MWSGRRFVRPDLIYALRLMDTIFARRITSFPLSEESACNGIKGAYSPNLRDEEFGELA